MIFPIAPTSAENAIIPSPTEGNIIFPKSKGAVILAPLSGLIVKVDTSSNPLIVIETLSQSKRIKITQLFENATLSFSKKAGDFITEGDQFAVAQDNLQWICGIEGPGGKMPANAYYVAGLLGGMFFVGDAKNAAIAQNLQGVKEDFIFVSKVGIGSAIVGAVLGYAYAKS